MLFRSVLDNAFTPFIWVAGPQPYGSSYTRNYTVPAGQPYAGRTASMMDFRIQKIFTNGLRSDSFEEETSTYDIGMRGVLANGYEWDISYTDNTYDVVSKGRDWLRSALFDKIFNIGGVDGWGNPCVLDTNDLIDGDPSNGEVVDTYGWYAYSASYSQPNCYN